MWSLETLKKMDFYDFELLVAEMFEALGYATQVTPRTRDFGVDILIKLEHFGLSHSWIVQAKKYSGSVGVREVREYGSLRMRDNVDGVIIVTTGYFSKDALEEAGKYNVKLISGDILTGMLNRYLPRANAEKEIMAQEEQKDAGELLLRENEAVLLQERVTINGNRFELVLSNKNLFLKEMGLLSRKSTLKHKIPISKIIGAVPEKKGIMLFIGGENIQTCSVKGNGKVLDILNQVNYSAIRQEKLLKYCISGGKNLMLTNRRLFFTENGNVWQLPIARISGVEIKSGLLTRRIVLYITGRQTEKKEFHVDDAEAWKSEIESAVRSS